MSVFHKKRKNGTLSENWYYEFEIAEKRYRGSTFKTSKKDAIDFENSLKNELKDLLKSDDPEKVKRKNLIHFREKITSEVQGESILIEDIWEIFRKKAPAKMRRIPSEKGWTEKEAYLNDFLAFLKVHHPLCRTLRDVTAFMAEEYIGLIKVSGRFSKTVLCKGGSYQNKNTKLSASSINEYILQLRQIFRILYDSAGLLENPFGQIQKAPNKSKKRDVFELHELEKIDSYLKKLKTNPPLFKRDRLSALINEAIFTIGINTGLRKGDISRLLWSNVDFNKSAIEMELSKTGENVFIPLTKPLFDFLKEKEQTRINKFVTPELAEMYNCNAEGITYRFKQMLNRLGIESLKVDKKRSRRVSNKDIHSLRHTFCYLHGMQGTKLILLQSMVGHVDKKMTESYMMHQTEELKREAINKFSLKPFQSISLMLLNDDKQLAIELLKNCQSDKIVEDIIRVLKSEAQLIVRGGPEGGTRR